MSEKLQCIDGKTLTRQYRDFLNTQIGQLIVHHKNNRAEINCLAFACVEAMIADDEWRLQLPEKELLSPLKKRVTGSNPLTAQYAGQQILQRLAEQNLMSFELIAALLNRLNATEQVSNGETQHIRRDLKKFLRHNQDEIVKQEVKLEKIERNIDLLTWQSSLGHLAFQGKGYVDLDTPGKLVCLVRDFIDTTKENWRTLDLLLLKEAMSVIGLDPQSKINYGTTLQEIHDNPALQEKLLDGASIGEPGKSPYLIFLDTLKKLTDLDGRDRHIVNIVSACLSNKGIHVAYNKVRNNLAFRYMKNRNRINLNIEVRCYDFMLELLYTLWQAHKMDVLVLSESDLDTTLKKAKEWYQQGHIEDAVLKFEELSRQGYGPAMVSLGIYYQESQNNSQALEWYEKGGKAGCDWGWVCLGAACTEGEIVEQNYDKALYYYWLAYTLEGDAKEDAAFALGYIYYQLERYDQGNNWFKKASELGNDWAWYALGEFYYNGKIAKPDYIKAIEYYEKGYKLHGDAEKVCAESLEKIYKAQGKTTECEKWRKIAQEL